MADVLSYSLTPPFRSAIKTPPAGSTASAIGSSRVPSASVDTVNAVSGPSSTGGVAEVQAAVRKKINRGEYFFIRSKKRTNEIGSEAFKGRFWYLIVMDWLSNAGILDNSRPKGNYPAHSAK